MSDDTYEYDLFISYSTSSDYALARDLEGFLGSFHELPTPENMPLKILRVWRDETGRSLKEEGKTEITPMLERYLSRCRCLMMLWSTTSNKSKWMRFEFDWFREHRDTSAIMLGITDASDPSATKSSLFWPEMIEAGMDQRPWYDFRGYNAETAATALKLRDFDEARVQLAADLNGMSPSEVQPIWWRNKLREQQERADAEERSRRRIELAECDARLEAGQGWYERAFVFFGEGRFRHAARCLLNAVSISPPDRVPEHYNQSELNPGWCVNSWSFLKFCAGQAPRRRRRLDLGSPIARLHNSRLGSRSDAGNALWLADGRLIALLVETPEGDIEDNNDALLIRLLDSASETVAADLMLPPDQGSLTFWAVSRRADRIVAGTSSGQLFVWSGADWGLLSYRAHDVEMTALAISGDGKRIATGDASGLVREWSLDSMGGLHRNLSIDLKDDDQQAAEPADSGREDRLAVKHLSFARGDTSLLFRRDGKLLEQPLDGSEQTTFRDVLLTEGIGQDSSGRRIAYSDMDIISVVSLPEWSEGKRLPENTLIYEGQHKDVVDQISFSALDHWLLSRDTSGKVCVWSGDERPLERGHSFMDVRFSQTFGRSNRGSLVKHLEGPGRVDAFDLHPTDSNRLIVERRGAVEEWELGFSCRPTDGWTPSYKGARAAAWLGDGRILAGSDDGSIIEFSQGQSAPVRVISDGIGAVGDLAVSSDGTRFASASEDGAVRVWATESGEVVAQKTGADAPFTVTFVGDKPTLAIGYADGSVWLWDYDRSETMHRLGTVKEAPLGLAATPCGRIVAAASKGDVAAWDTGLELELWSLNSEGHLSRFIAAGRLAVSPDGSRFACGDISGNLLCFDAKTGKVVSQMELEPTVPMKPRHVTAVTFAYDGRIVFAGLWDGSLCVVDAFTGRVFFRYQAHAKVITAIEYRSGHILTAALDSGARGSANTIRVWNPLASEDNLPAHPRGVDWSEALETFFDHYGHGGDNPYGDGDDGLQVHVDVTSPPLDDKLLPEVDAQFSIPVLRAALLQEPDSPDRNLDLGMAYLERNEPGKALDYLLRVTRFGGDELVANAKAAYTLAEFYLKRGEPALAIPWLRRAAEKEQDEALLQLGILHLTGQEVHRNDRAGLDCLHRSAGAGNAAAAYNLGVYHEHHERGALAQTDWRQLAFGESSTEPPESLRRALAWYEKAAEGGYGPAESRLGDFFAAGDLVEQDLEKARWWYQRAVRSGHYEAEAKLSNLD